MPTPNASQNPPRVLVIETSPTIGLLIGSLLRRRGSEVELAQPGTLLPNTATYDLMIAEPEPADPALEKRRQAARTAGIPWLAIVSSEVATTAADADADAWLQKPVRPQALYDAVDRCLSRTRPIREENGIDPETIAALWGSTDNATFRKIARVFLGEMEQRLSAIASHLAAEHRPGLLLEAHSVASAAENVGCLALSRASRALEAAAPEHGMPEISARAQAIHAIARRDLPVLTRLIEMPLTRPPSDCPSG